LSFIDILFEEISKVLTIGKFEFIFFAFSEDLLREIVVFLCSH